MPGAHGTDWSSVALAAPAVGALAVAPFTGIWCDRVGHRPVLLVSLVVFTVSVLILATSQHVAGFIVGRVLQGASAIGVMLTACIGHVSAPASRNRAFGLQESAVAAGALLGPVLGGVLQDVWSPRPMLLAVAALNALLTLALSTLLRDMPTHTAPVPSAGKRRPIRDVLMLRRWLAAACLSQAGAFALVNVFVLYLQQRAPHDALLASKAGTPTRSAGSRRCSPAPGGARAMIAWRPGGIFSLPRPDARRPLHCCRWPPRSGRLRCSA
jgi:MFS family permease